MGLAAASNRDNHTRSPAASGKARTSELVRCLLVASFATGDEAYVRPIYAYYGSVASLPGVDVRDIVAMVVLRHRPNKDAMDVITKKYPQDTLVRLVYAASALWSLESNGRQHKFVATALDRYAKEKPKSPATEGLAELRRAVAAARGVQ